MASAFTNPLVVLDVDQYGNPVSGVTVTFTPPASGASGTFTTSATAVTGSNGQATSNTYTANTIRRRPLQRRRLGLRCHPHDQLLRDQHRQDAGDTLSLVSGTGQSATVATAFTNPLVVKDADQYGNPVSGVTVTFTPPSSGASGTFTDLGHRGDRIQRPGHLEHLHGQHDRRRPLQRRGLGPGATSASFPETNVAGSAHTLTATSGSGQSATVATAFTNQLVATVTDQYGNPVSGVTVTFTPPASGASGTFTTSSTAVTNASGVATSNTYTANTTAGGPYNVVASATGLTSVNYSETNTAKTTGDTLSLVSGNGQSATVAAAFSNPLVVKDVDQYGNLVSGVTVTFTAPTSGASGTFTTSSTAVTGSNGQATSNTYTANTTAGGPYNVVASATGASSVSFPETNTAKTTGDTLAATSGSGQTTTVGIAFANPLVATVTDQYGNPVSGVTVTFTPPASGASGSFTTSATAVTGSNGQATSNTYTANTTAGGPYNVVASATGVTSVNFSETNRVALTASSVASGTGTTSVTSSTFAQTSGKTYLITAYESSSGNGTPSTPAPTVPVGSGAPTLITTNNFGGASSPNCAANYCYEWAWWYNAGTTNGSASVTLAFTNTPQASVVDVIALSGNSTTTPIVTASTTIASSTSATTISADTANAPAAGDITLQLLASDNQMGSSAVTWSPASSNLYFHNGASTTDGASLQVNAASPGQQNESASALGFSSTQDWGTIALEIGHS